MLIKSSDSKLTSCSLILIMSNRSYAHPSLQMNFYWKLRVDCFAITFIFDEVRGFLSKEGMSWKVLICLMPQTRNCSFGPQSYTSYFIMGLWTFLSCSIWRSNHSLHVHEVLFWFITKAMLILEVSEIVHRLCQVATSYMIILGFPTIDGH